MVLDYGFRKLMRLIWSEERVNNEKFVSGFAETSRRRILSLMKLLPVLPLSMWLDK